MKILTNNPSQTKKIGENLAKKILKAGPKKKAFVVSLVGELGGGKTIFLQGFAKGLGIREKVLSPTFVIMRKFEIKNSNQTKEAEQSVKFKNFYHFDCYRVEKPKEMLELNFQKIISNFQNLIAIEWADKIQKIVPKDSLAVKFDFINEKTRKINIKTKFLL